MCLQICAREGGEMMVMQWLTMGLVACCCAVILDSPAQAGGKTYEGSELSAPCVLWSNERLKWPQTILGREKAECRRRAVDSKQSNTFCRLIRNYIDPESGERMCVYKRQGNGLQELTVSMSASFKCQADFMCARE